MVCFHAFREDNPCSNVFVSPKQKLLAKILNILEGVIKNSTVILDNIFLVKIKAISRSLPVKEGKELKVFFKLQTVANELPLLCMFYLWAITYIDQGVIEILLV